MSAAIRLSEGIISEAKIVSKVLNRSLEGQIEHWVRIGRLAEENPDLTYDLIKNVLIAREEVEADQVELYPS